MTLESWVKYEDISLESDGIHKGKFTVGPFKKRYGRYYW